MTKPKRTIVIAWTATERVWDGKPFAADMGARARLVEVTTAHALVWLNAGDASDQGDARAYAKTMDRATVMTFPMTHPDPLGAARALVMAVVS